MLERHCHSPRVRYRGHPVVRSIPSRQTQGVTSSTVATRVVATQTALHPDYPSSLYVTSGSNTTNRLLEAGKGGWNRQDGGRVVGVGGGLNHDGG